MSSASGQVPNCKSDLEVLPVLHIYHCATLVSLDSQVAHDKGDQSERNG